MDEKLKKDFDKFCEDLGLTMTAAINMFIKTVVREQKIPFELSLHTPNAETLAAIDDIEHGRNLIGPFETVEEAMKAMLEDD